MSNYLAEFFFCFYSTFFDGIYLFLLLHLCGILNSLSLLLGFLDTVRELLANSCVELNFFSSAYSYYYPE